MSGIDADRTISRVARAALVSVETIRYYQRRGLIVEPAKPRFGYRIYPQATVERIRFIKHAKEAGFTLTEVKNLLALGDGNCPEACALAERKLDAIEGRIHDLQAMHGMLRKLVRSCKQHDGGPEGCPLIHTLADRGT